MRERLTAAFVATTLVLTVGAALVRGFTIRAELRDHAAADVASLARAVGEVLGTALGQGGRVDGVLLEPFVADDTQLVYESPGRDPLVLTGDGYDSDSEPITATVVTGADTLTVRRDANAGVDLSLTADWPATLSLFGLLAVVSGLLGYAVARALSSPFQRLAVAAAALGRGRFDLDLPRSKVPEAHAIAQALESSATQLRDRVSRDIAFGLHASHALRTPLTTLRFRVEEMLLDPDLGREARLSAEACLEAVSRLDAAAGELVEMGGRGVLVAGAAIPLRDLATGVAQRWADLLDADHRRLSAAVEGDIELLFTPGPVEQTLDLLLHDVLDDGSGPVRLVFEGAASRLRVDVTVGAATTGGVVVPPREPSDDVRAAIQAMGGRVERPADADVLRLHLPRR